MEGKGLLKVMPTQFWLVIQTGSPLLGRSPASAWGLRLARSLGQKARSRLTGADVARSAVEMQLWCQSWMLWSSVWLRSVLRSCGGKVCHSRCLSGPFGEKGGLFLPAVAKRWGDAERWDDDVLLRVQGGCGFLAPESDPPGLAPVPSKVPFPWLQPRRLLQILLCTFVSSTRKRGSSLRDLYPSAASPSA